MQKITFVRNIFLSLFLITLLQSASASSEMTETVNALAIQPGEPALMFAGTNNGLFINKNGEWKAADFTENDISDIAIHPVNPDLIYLVTSEGSLHKSINAGKDWSTVSVTSDNASFELRTIAISTSNQSVVIAGSERGLLLKSKDAGNSWSIINPDFPITSINSIAIHPQEADTLFIGTGGNGIFKSINGGKDWTPLNDGLTDTTVTSLLIDFTNHSRLFAGTYGGGIFKSTNGGKSWESANSGLSGTFVYSMALSPSKSGDSGVIGFLSNQVKRITDGTGTDIYASVYGGSIYKSNTKETINWKPL